MKTLTLKVQVTDEDYYIFKAALKTNQVYPHGVIESAIMAVEEQADGYLEDKKCMKESGEKPIFDETMEKYIKLRNRYLRKLEKI